MIAWTFSMNSLVLPLHHLQRVVRCVELCPQALNRPDLNFEGAGNGPVVISWIGRGHELYSRERLRDRRKKRKKEGFH